MRDNDVLTDREFGGGNQGAVRRRSRLIVGCEASNRPICRIAEEPS